MELIDKETENLTAIGWTAMRWVKKNAERILKWDVCSRPSNDVELSHMIGRDAAVCRNEKNGVLIKVGENTFQAHIWNDTVMMDF
jgi:hypothetical protein